MASLTHFWTNGRTIARYLNPCSTIVMTTSFLLWIGHSQLPITHLILSSTPHDNDNDCDIYPIGFFMWGEGPATKAKNELRFISHKNGLGINSEIAEKETWSIEDFKARTSSLVIQLLEMFKFPL